MAWEESSSTSAAARRRDEAGFSIIETMVAVTLLAIVSLGVAQLFAVGTLANFRSKSQTSSTLLAVQKMEQMKGLTWGFDAQGLPVSDTATNLAAATPTGGGRGLNPSPDGTLTANVDGYFDLLEQHGGVAGPGQETAYVRRWSITPLPQNPNNTLIFQVRVIPAIDVARVDAVAGARSLGETQLISIKTRKAP
jgi:prepilin-type N-terminal cleavage/methylation domain-containing protein